MRSENQDAISREFRGVLMYELYLVQLSTGFATTSGQDY